jgi:hypothetical protein
MRRFKPLLAITLVLLSINSFAQTTLIPFKPVKSSFWGFVDLNGKIVIPAIYSKFQNFSEGYASVMDAKGKCMIIDASGAPLKVAFEKFEIPSIGGINLEQFNEGLLNVIVSKKFATINIKGEIVHEAIYDKIADYSNGFAIGNIGEVFYRLNADGTKKQISEPMLEVRSFKEGFAPYRAKNGQFGFIDSNGEVTVKATFESVGYFVDGLAWAKTMEKTVGFIDTKGAWVVQPSYLAAKEFDKETGYALVKTVAGWHFINKKNEILNVQGVTTYGEFNHGLAYARLGEKVGFINNKGAWVIEAKYVKVENFKGKYANVKTEAGWGLIDNTGKTLLETSYQGVTDVYEGIFAYKQNGFWGFMNIEGKILTDAKFSAIRDFSNGYAAVRVGELWGLIDSNGKIVIEAQFERLQDVLIIK